MEDNKEIIDIFKKLSKKIELGIKAWINFRENERATVKDINTEILEKYYEFMKENRETLINLGFSHEINLCDKLIKQREDILDKMDIEENTSRGIEKKILDKDMNDDDECGLDSSERLDTEDVLNALKHAKAPGERKAEEALKHVRDDLDRYRDISLKIYGPINVADAIFYIAQKLNIEERVASNLIYGYARDKNILKYEKGKIHIDIRIVKEIVNNNIGLGQK